MQDGIDMAYEYGGQAYGMLTEAFWTATGLYKRQPTVDAALVVSIEHE